MIFSQNKINEINCFRLGDGVYYSRGNRDKKMAAGAGLIRSERSSKLTKEGAYFIEPIWLRRLVFVYIFIALERNDLLIKHIVSTPVML